MKKWIIKVILNAQNRCNLQFPMSTTSKLIMEFQFKTCRLNMDGGKLELGDFEW